MKHYYSTRLLGLVSGVALLGSCTNDNMISESSSSLPVSKQEVTISCFDTETTDIGTLETRAVTPPASLKDTKKFTELEVALIPIESEDSGYVVRQDSTLADFGNVKLEVPPGTYNMVVVAANTKDLSAGRVTIHSSTNVTFPTDTPSDMVYACQQITVAANVSSQAFAATLTRGVSAFKLQATDFPTLKSTRQTISITGDCGTAFNPTTGKCVTANGATRNYTFDPAKYQGPVYPYFIIYTFLNDDDVSNLTVDAVSADTDGNTLRSLHFDDVHLVKGKATIYKGNVFTTNNTAAFTVATTTMEESDYSKEF